MPTAQIKSPSNCSSSSSSPSPTTSKTFNPSPGPATSPCKMYPRAHSPPPLLPLCPSSGSQHPLGYCKEAPGPLLPNNLFPSQQAGRSFRKKEHILWLHCLILESRGFSGTESPNSLLCCSRPSDPASLSSLASCPPLHRPLALAAWVPVPSRPTGFLCSRPYICFPSFWTLAPASFSSQVLPPQKGLP